MFLAEDMMFFVMEDNLIIFYDRVVVALLGEISTRTYRDNTLPVFYAPNAHHLLADFLLIMAKCCAIKIHS